MSGDERDDTAEGEIGRVASLITSDHARNGKTLFAKLIADLFRLRSGATPAIFDTDHPDGDLSAHFPGASKLLDVTRTTDQVALFDGMLGTNEAAHYVVDIVARHHKRFFDIYCDTGFETGAREAGLNVSVFFVLDRSRASLAAAATLRHRLRETDFVLVRVPAIGDVMAEPDLPDYFGTLRPSREITVPPLSPDALGMLEHPEFHFDTFVSDGYAHFPFELKAELWAFLEDIHAQKASVDHGAAQPV